MWDGQGNLEEYEATLPDGTRLRGLALRLYNPKARRWTIHWSNSANGTLDPPMTGAFHEALGVFYSHEEYEGRMILVRFHWRSLRPHLARWEQAFSADGGATWEASWIMESLLGFLNAIAVHQIVQRGLQAGTDHLAQIVGRNGQQRGEITQGEISAAVRLRRPECGEQLRRVRLRVAGIESRASGRMATLSGATARAGARRSLAAADPDTR